MWVFLFVFILFHAWLTSFFYSSLHIFVFVSLIYALVYFASRGWKDGSRQWPWLRELGIWDRLRSYWFSHSWHQVNGWKDFNRYGEAYIFILHPRCYGIASFFAFGLHGCHAQKNFQTDSLLITMPTFLFYIPVLSDILQYAGCIKHDRECVQRALDHKNSVVWSIPSRSAQIVVMGDPEKRDFSILDGTREVRLFDWISQYGQDGLGRNKINIVPVFQSGEWDAYYNPRDRLPPWLSSIQDFFREQIGYEFPLVVFGWMGTFVPRKCVLRTIVGTPIPVIEDLPDGRKKIRSGNDLWVDFTENFEKLLAADPR